MFLIKNVSIEPLEKTPTQGARICFPDKSLGCHLWRALANFRRMVGYTISNFAPIKIPVRH